MQTFLPSPDYSKSAQLLDDRRLGKQRVECLQILKALHDSDYGWQHHPAVKMWRGHEQSLVHYGAMVCREWIARGFRDTCLDKILAFAESNKPCLQVPDWVTDELCRSHQSNLIRKRPEFYGPLFPGVPDDLPYVWPVTSRSKP